ncbi:type II secretion system F family protein [Nocardioides donggukensis]|uniref:Type II secretion system F family protein n=1 Tax=Nocardioides donggukensis TaxID=2774019 RepID=A0A927K8H2_9ACTN|nr:type II secretion system F family protein [Nocardioides donggukensis]MBD8870923.1 type II secretion system F family protein [Nocardioides donggukensis]
MLTGSASAVLVAVALVLLAPPRPARAPWAARASSSRAGGGTAIAGLLPGLVLLGAGAVALIAVTGSTALVRAAVVVAAAVTAGWLLRRSRRRAAAARRTGIQVRETCDALAAELAAGQTPQAALDAAGRHWAAARRLARTARLGGSVPEALRALSCQPGAGDLRLVAGAWQVSHRSGGGLAESLAVVARMLREREASRRVVRSELASARATANLVAGLPVLTLTVGSGGGAAPAAFLIGTGPGVALLAAGLGLAGIGLAWIDAIARSVDRAGP